MLYDVDFMNNRGFLKTCALLGFVYPTNLRCLPVFFTFPTQNEDLLYHSCLVKNVPKVVLFLDHKPVVSKFFHLMSLGL